MSARHESETLQEYHDRLEHATTLTKARLRGMPTGDGKSPYSGNRSARRAPRVAK